MTSHFKVDRTKIDVRRLSLEMVLRVELSPLKLFHILTCTEHSHCAESIAGVKQEQWERWRAKRKLVSGFKHRGLFCGGFSGGGNPLKKF